MIKRLAYWISDVTEAQKAAVSAWSSQLVPIAESWLQHREQMQAEARRLLIRAKTAPESRITLQKLISNPEQMNSPHYQQKIDMNTDITIKFILQLDRLLSLRQRSDFIKRIESLAADVDNLSCDPKDKPDRSSGFSPAEVGQSDRKTEFAPG